MRRVVFALTAVVLAGGVAYGQPNRKIDPKPELKCYVPFIGTWRYEGPLLEDVPEMAEKGAKCVVEFSWRWILDKNAVESSAHVEVDGKAIYSEKALIGWNGGDQKIAYGGMTADGMIFLGSTTHEGKTLTSESEGKTAEGEDTSYKGAVTKTDRDTLTWKAESRAGGIVEGPSPVYTFKRIKRAGQGKRKSKVPQAVQVEKDDGE